MEKNFGKNIIFFLGKLTNKQNLGKITRKPNFGKKAIKKINTCELLGIVRENYGYWNW